MKYRELHFKLRLPQPTLHFQWRAWLPSRGNVLFTLLVVGLLLWAQTAGAVPLGLSTAATSTTAGTIAYQGRLADANGAPITNTVNMIFRLYNQATGGTPLWEEQWTGSNAVQVSDGLFNVMLGSLTPIPQSVITGNGSLFLGITVGTDDEMSPRVQLGNVPWAVQALTVPDGSITTEKIADGAVTSAKIAVASVERSNFASMTGIVWKVPPANYWEHKVEWTPTQNSLWDISIYLEQAAVPQDAELILLGWRPSLISDLSDFELLTESNQVLATVRLGTELPELTWAPLGPEFGSPIPVPGSTRKIRYIEAGGYAQAASIPRRVITIYGWR